VLEAAEEALTKQGLVVDTLQIQEIRDGADYITNIGRPEAAKVRQQADIAETNAYQASEEAKIAAEKVLLDRNRELKLRQAEIQAETDKASAQAAAADPLEQAIQRQAIVQQQELTAQREVALKKEQLNAEVRAVAEAEAFKVEALAKANAAAAVATAEAEAKATEAKGVAEAKATEAKGLAEAKAVEARGRAFASQADSVLAQELIHLLPTIAHEYAQAIGGIENMTVVSTDGTSKVAGEAMGNFKGLLEMAKDTVGIDLAAMLNGAVTGGAAGAAASRASARGERSTDAAARAIADAATETAEAASGLAEAVDSAPSIGGDASATASNPSE
jgi:flotillin